MNEPATEEMESRTDPIRQEAYGCPLQTMHTQRTVLDADDELVFPKHKRVLTQYSTDASGAAELHLYLQHVDANETCPASTHGARPSPLPPAHSALPHTWFEPEAITRELTGHPLELGYLKLVRPFTLVSLRSSVQRSRPAWGWPINVRWARIY